MIPGLESTPESDFERFSEFDDSNSHSNSSKNQFLYYTGIGIMNFSISQLYTSGCSSSSKPPVSQVSIPVSIVGPPVSQEASQERSPSLEPSQCISQSKSHNPTLGFGIWVSEG